MLPKIIVFDLDGTLLDTLDDLADAGNEVLKKSGFPEHARNGYKYFVGDGMRVLIDRITPDTVFGKELDACCALFEDTYSSCWDNKTRVYDGIAEMIVKLKNLGIKLTILSNKPHEFTKMCVENYFPENSFDLVFGQRQGVAKKPDPAGAYEIARLLGVNPEECMYVGDTAVDMQTGKSAGMFTVGVLWGFRDFEELQRNKADLIVKHPMEIVKHVVSSS